MLGNRAAAFAQIYFVQCYQWGELVSSKLKSNKKTKAVCSTKSMSFELGLVFACMDMCKR